MASNRRQAGQAIVIVALAIVVLIGFLGLAIDGGRGYMDRRQMQTSVDAAALAAAYDFMNNSDYGRAENAAIRLYSTNERLGSSPSCSGVGSTAVSCSFGDSTGQQMTISVTSRAVAGTAFKVTGSHAIPLTIMQVLGAGPSMRVSTTATAVARKGGHPVAIATLSPDGCPGPSGYSLRITGTEDTSVVGDVWSNGSLTSNGSATAEVDGDAVTICPPIPPNLPGVTATGTQANGSPLEDPNFAMPALDLTTQTWSRYNVLQNAGTYSADPNLSGGAGCYFLNGGVYSFSAGFSANGGFLSNELRPPDEPNLADVTQRAPVQFWDTNAVNCSGSFQPYPSPAGGAQAVRVGTYGVVVTAIRWTPNGIPSCSGPASPSCLLRESAPSMCRPVDVTANQILNVWFSNVPGAMGYRVYVSSDSCAGPFGYLGTVDNTVVASNRTVSGCTPVLGRNAEPPNPLGSCTLGTTSKSFNGSDWAPDFTVRPPDPEAAPPVPDLPNADPGPASAVPPAGDRANENQCVNSDGVRVACPRLWMPGYTTPGAVEFFIPGTTVSSCPNTLTILGGSAAYLFSGQQYRRILLYEPGPLQSAVPNMCLNKEAGGSGTSLLGIFYLPAASITVTGVSHYTSTISGGVIAWTATIEGNGTVSIVGDPSLRMVPPWVGLTQ